LPLNQYTGNDNHIISRIPVWNFSKKIIPPLKPTKQLSSEGTSTIRRLSKKETKLQLHLAVQEESRKAKNPIREVPTEVNPGEQNDTIDGDQIKQLKRNKFGYNSEAFRGRRIVLPDIATKIPKLALIPAPRWATEIFDRKKKKRKR